MSEPTLTLAHSPEAEVLTSPVVPEMNDNPFTDDLGKTPRGPSRLNSLDGYDFSSSPARRGRAYPSIHETLEMSKALHSTPKAAQHSSHSVSQSDDPSRNILSSPSFQSPLGVHMTDTGLQYGSYGDDIGHVGSPTPTHSPATRTLKRGLEGLGSSPMRSAKRSRFATLGSNSSFPPSPLRHSREHSGASAGPSYGLMTNQPLARAASMSGSLHDPLRIVSNASMISTTSTELVSPHLAPYSSYMYNDMDPYSSHPSPVLNMTIAPSALPGSGYSRSNLYQSPDMMESGYMPSVHASAPLPYTSMASPLLPPPSPMLASFPTDRGMALGTIHEGHHGMVTPAAEHHDFTPGLTYSVNMPSHAVFPQHAHSYPSVPGLGYGGSGQGSASAPNTGPFWIHHDDDEDADQPSNFGPASFGVQGGQQAYGYAHVQRSASYTYDPSAYGYNPREALPRSVSASYVPTQANYQNFASSSMYPGPSSAPMGSSASLPVVQEGYEYEVDEAAWNSQPIAPHLIHPGSYNEPPATRSSSVMLSSPMTPSKPKYPTVGNRLKPGPKPKNTPKKPKNGTKQEPDSAGAGSQATDSRPPSPIAATRFVTRAQSADVKHQFGGPLQGVPAFGPLGPRAPTMGGSLSQGSMPASSSMASASMSSSHPQPQARPHGHMPQAMGMIPMTRQEEEEQPMLVLAPPAPSGSTAASLLPKEFIDKLYAVIGEENPKAKGGGTKRFQCLIEGCERIFPRKSAICSHIQTHLDDKPYQCPEDDCTASFVRQHDLRRHVRIHTGTKPFPCACGKGFARGDALMRHRQRNICAGGIPQIQERTDFTLQHFAQQQQQQQQQQQHLQTQHHVPMSHAHPSQPMHSAHPGHAGLGGAVDAMGHMHGLAQGHVMGLGLGVQVQHYG